MTFSTHSNKSFQDKTYSSPMEAGRQKNGKLWSNLKDICSLLRIPAPNNTPVSASTPSASHSKCFTLSIQVFSKPS